MYLSIRCMLASRESGDKRRFERLLPTNPPIRHRSIVHAPKSARAGGSSAIDKGRMPEASPKPRLAFGSEQAEKMAPAERFPLVASLKRDRSFASCPEGGSSKSTRSKSDSSKNDWQTCVSRRSPQVIGATGSIAEWTNPVIEASTTRWAKNKNPLANGCVCAGATALIPSSPHQWAKTRTIARDCRSRRQTMPHRPWMVSPTQRHKLQTLQRVAMRG